MNDAFNALHPFFVPQPSLEVDLRQLISRHGKEAVRAAVKELTKAKRGRKPDPDWKLLMPIVRMDAEDWLAGRDPTLKPRTNYGIAQAVASARPGHSPSATARRIMRKLKSGRRFFFLTIAEQDGRSGAPFAAYLRTLEALTDCGVHPVWRQILAHARDTLERYRERHGEPQANLTFDQIEEGSRPPNALGGLAALLGKTTGLLPSFREE